MFALRQALDMLYEEGLENVFLRHRIQERLQFPAALLAILWCRRLATPGFVSGTSSDRGDCNAAYLASTAVTSTSIAIWGHANWLTTRNVEAGIGALPNASARHFSAS
jgi:hypothetical protein